MRFNSVNSLEIGNFFSFSTSIANFPLELTFLTHFTIRFDDMNINHSFCPEYECDQSFFVFCCCDSCTLFIPAT